MAITIALADDHGVYREYVRNKLDQEPDMTVLAEAEDGQAAVRIVQDLARQNQAPDLVIMDLTMPRLNGLEATRQILTSHPSVKVLALSIHEDRPFVEAMVKAGACGYMFKDDDLAELLRAIRAVAAGQTYFSPALGLPGNADPGHVPPPP